MLLRRRHRRRLRRRRRQRSARRLGRLDPEPVSCVGFDEYWRKRGCLK